jgi:hypothetical protein
MNQPQIGKPTLFLSGKLLLVNFCETVPVACSNMGSVSYGLRLAPSMGSGVPAVPSSLA